MLMDILFAIMVFFTVFCGYAVMLFFRDALPVILADEIEAVKKDGVK